MWDAHSEIQNQANVCVLYRVYAARTAKLKAEKERLQKWSKRLRQKQERLRGKRSKVAYTP